jgi:UDP-glucose 4-epimerase
VHGDGTQSRDFTFVGTVAAVITDAVQRRVADAEAVNLAFGTRIDLLSLVDRLSTIVGRTLEVEHLDPRPGDVPHSQADSSRLRALFPDIEPVDLDAGLRETVTWFESVGGS